MENNLNAYWMGFTANRQFKQSPRMFSKSKGMFYYTPENLEVMDSIAGLWCVNAGHCRSKIVNAVQQQVAELDYSPAFQMGHPKAFELANRLTNLLPNNLQHVFYTGSGSESVETALKIALAYHRAKGQGQKTILIGRERAYHGVNFGGMSVGGMVANRKMFANLLGNVDHLPHTHDISKNAFSRGLPSHGMEKADALNDLLSLHDPSTVAAVIVEPISGSAGVLLPPKGYLEKLRAICDQHDILLIFDEVITGFGRLGDSFATNYFGVTPDILTTAKGLTNGTVPMGAVMISDGIYQAFMHGPEHMVELFHGYTFSGHPLACAAALASLDVYEEENLFQRQDGIYQYWEDAMHSMMNLPYVIDIRNLGLIGAIELEPVAGSPGKRAFQAFLNAYEAGLLIRTTGDTIAFSPPLIIEKQHIDRLVETVSKVLKHLT
ncbi:aspartate aminotransferase family protein [Spartinivicinus poritis]|uniref:Aspartate aminotransferase family protein n=1 Tax=Spartinivicinus poritis TaxID=2994640 RepID=A0ABT5U2P6_9GAMM|nr:aspartate aminotransferase family protein [Spartinivicinus sp. A2-2]MDE1460643.1 aspartate aminotransferase family protein [Spartinivicinus sp. A2-2]